jgi:hypothetical protein
LLLNCRDVAERIMGLREHIAQEMQEELAAIHAANSEVNRRCAEPLVLGAFTVVATSAVPYYAW